jgi:hypothetical protein
MSKLTYNGIVLDKSGSMYPVRDSTYSSLMKFQADQLEDEVINHSSPLIIHTFSNDVTLEHQKKLSDQIKFDYHPSGGTALYDAIGVAVSHAQKYMDTTLDKPEIVNIIIMTDGMENSSVEYNSNTIKELFKTYQEKGWEFIFLGANQDSILTGGDMGLQREQCLNFNQSPAGYMNAMRSVSQAVKRKVSSNAANVVFNDEERMTSMM